MAYSYYSRIPAAAVKTEIDGHTYAHIPHRLTAPNGGKVKITEDYENPRYVRVEPVRIESGEVFVRFGCAGGAVAQLDGLPFGVTVERIAGRV